MSWLLFMDESGYDHRVMPYEVTGGIALLPELLPGEIRVRNAELDEPAQVEAVSTTG